MVISLIVDRSDEADVPLPDMMFAEGEEPIGVRVLTYQSSRAINTILNALHEDEIQFLRASPFGKMVEIAEKPAFSGRFSRFLLSRQLKVKKYTRLEKTNPKKKKNIKANPYWLELFGTIRIKIACLAIVSSVLLSTNLKMKMLKEYAELLIDINQFFAFPWGRLAFNMLMSSIKKRDEIGLSQNTISLQGFALALQLVIVEAVPSLTDVVQEACSSSESDSDDEDNEVMPYKTKKQTLSPGHAREVDKQSEVLVRSIIPQDPSRPLDESLLFWTDEVDDFKVRNLLNFISINRVFTKEMFRGGATKLEVERMREKPKPKGRNEISNRKHSSTGGMEESQIIAVVSSMLKPEMERMDGRITAAIASFEQMSSSALLYKASVISVVEGMLKTFKEEMLSSVRDSRVVPTVAQDNSASESRNNNNLENVTPLPNPTNPMTTPPRSMTSNPVTTAPPNKADNQSRYGIPQMGAADRNNDIIMNVMENLSHYSTPPKSGDPSPVCVYPLTPLRNLAVGYEIAAPNPARKSKRLKLVPPPLLADYQCESAILNRAREAKMGGTNYYDISVIREKFTKLLHILQRPCVINVAGISVSGKDIIDIAERTRPLPGKTSAINFLHTSFWEQPSEYGGVSRYQDAARGMPPVDSIPYNVDKKHWIGLCVDFFSNKVYVLDSNTSLRTDAALTHDLQHISLMFPHLLKRCGLLEVPVGKPLILERVKGLAQNPISADAAMTAALLIQTHALFGTDTCRCITPSILPDEAKRAAVMIYEFYAKL
ncbi:hypothetical protein Bca4012_027279 [Brassica carinata]